MIDPDVEDDGDTDVEGEVLCVTETLPEFEGVTDGDIELDGVVLGL